MMSINSSLTKSLSSKQMTKQVAIELLKQGNNGEEILSILDALTADETMTYAGNTPGQVVDFEGNPTEF